MITIKIEFIDKDDGGYFAFAPSLYTLSAKRISFGLELFGRRYFYTEIRRK